MKQENKSTQKVSAINIYIYEHCDYGPNRNILRAPHLDKNTSNESRPALRIACLEQHIPLFKFYFGYPIIIEGGVHDEPYWRGLFNYCQNTLLPLQDSLVQYTANEILNAKAEIISLCKKDLIENCRVVADLGIDISQMTDDQVWAAFHHHYFIQLIPEGKI